MIKYGLRLKGKNEILTYYVSPNENADCCVNETYSLSENEDKKWLVDTYEQAEYVVYHKTSWFNADYETPVHPYSPDELEIVKLEIIETISVMESNIIKVKLKDSVLQDKYYKFLTDYGNNFLPYESDILKDIIFYVKDYQNKYLIINTNNRHAQFDTIDCNRYILKKDCEII